MIRDYQGRGHSLRQTVERAESVDRGELNYIMPNKPNASIHIDTFHDYEPCILARYLKEIPEFYSQLDDQFIAEHGLKRPDGRCQLRAVAAHGLCPARLHRARVRRRQLL